MPKQSNEKKHSWIGIHLALLIFTYTTHPYLLAQIEWHQTRLSTTTPINMPQAPIDHWNHWLKTWHVLKPHALYYQEITYDPPMLTVTGIGYQIKNIVLLQQRLSPLYRDCFLHTKNNPSTAFTIKCQSN